MGYLQLQVISICRLMIFNYRQFHLLFIIIHYKNTRLTKYWKLLYGQEEQNMEMLYVKNKNIYTDFLTKTWNNRTF